MLTHSNRQKRTYFALLTEILHTHNKEIGNDCQYRANESAHAKDDKYLHQRLAYSIHSLSRRLILLSSLSMYLTARLLSAVLTS